MIKLKEISVKVKFNIDAYVDHCRAQVIMPSQDGYREWAIQQMAYCSEDELKITYSKTEQIVNNNKVSFVCLNKKLAKCLKRGHQVFKRKNGKIKSHGEFFKHVLDSIGTQVGVVVQDKKSGSLRYYDFDKIFILKSSVKSNLLN